MSDNAGRRGYGVLTWGADRSISNLVSDTDCSSRFVRFTRATLSIGNAFATAETRQRRAAATSSAASQSRAAALECTRGAFALINDQALANTGSGRTCDSAVQNRATSDSIATADAALPFASAGRTHSRTSFWTWANVQPECLSIGSTTTETTSRATAGGRMPKRRLETVGLRSWKLTSLRRSVGCTNRASRTSKSPNTSESARQPLDRLPSVKPGPSARPTGSGPS